MYRSSRPLLFSPFVLEASAKEDLIQRPILNRRLPGFILEHPAEMLWMLKP